MNDLPPFAALRAFESVARLGSVVKAAAELHVTHSAISHQLRSIEDDLKIRLLERRGRRLVLTDDGRMYAMRIRMATGVSDIVVPNVNPVWLVWSLRSAGQSKVALFAEWIEAEVRDYLHEVAGN
jgi:DNA-binding transcriptional LysR family regulator